MRQVVVNIGRDSSNFSHAFPYFWAIQVPDGRLLASNDPLCDYREDFFPLLFFFFLKLENRQGRTSFGICMCMFPD